MKKEFNYLVRITVGIVNLSIIIRNSKEVPDNILETIAKEKINLIINQSYRKFKHYRTQTLEKFSNKMIKESNFEIENLNEIEVFNLQLSFEKGNIKNEINEKNNIEIRQSSINRVEFNPES